MGAKVKTPKIPTASNKIQKNSPYQNLTSQKISCQISKHQKFPESVNNRNIIIVMECFCSYCSSHQQPSTFSASGGHGNNTRDTQEHILSATLCRVACVAGHRKRGTKVKMRTGGRRYHDPPVLCTLVFPLSLPSGRLPRRLYAEWQL